MTVKQGKVLSADKVYILQLFNELYDIKCRLKRIDSSKNRELFEKEYEALLDQFYENLLRIDEIIDGRLRDEKKIRERFKSLLRTASKFDELWDYYHKERIDIKDLLNLVKSNKLDPIYLFDFFK